MGGTNWASYLADLVYWLAVSTWFGGTLAVAVGAPIVFATLRDRLGNDPAMRIGGEIVADGLRRLGRAAVVCWATLALATFAHWLSDGRPDAPLAARTTLLLILGGTLAYDRLLLSPRLLTGRDAVLREQTASPTGRGPDRHDTIEDTAADQAAARLVAYDRDHAAAVRVLLTQLGLLLGLVLFGPIAPVAAATTVILR